MLINLKERNSKKLVVKDYLDVDFDMTVEENGKDKYVININKKYTFATEYTTRGDAEDEMIEIMNNRNQLEHEYREF